MSNYLLPSLKLQILCKHKEKKTWLHMLTHICRAIHILWITKLHGEHPPKKNHNIILTTIQIHLEINILDTKPMPNILKTPNHHYNVIKHKLQETNLKKNKTSCPQNIFSLHHWWVQLLSSCTFGSQQYYYIQLGFSSTLILCHRGSTFAMLCFVSWC